MKVRKVLKDYIYRRYGRNVTGDVNAMVCANVGEKGVLEGDAADRVENAVEFATFSLPTDDERSFGDSPSQWIGPPTRWPAIAPQLSAWASIWP